MGTAKIVTDCVAEYLTARRQKYREEYRDEKISNHFEASFIWSFTKAFKNGFYRANVKIVPKDIVYVEEYTDVSGNAKRINSYFWLLENGELLDIREEDIFSNNQ